MDIRKGERRCFFRRLFRRPGQPAAQFETRAEANDFRVEIENQFRTGTYRPEATKILVSELAELFLKHCEERMQRGERMTDAAWHAKQHAAPISSGFLIRVSAI